MKYTRLLQSSRKELSSNFGIPSQDLLVQAGFIRQLSAGIFSVLHFGQRSFQKLEQIIREEMNAIGGVEISMPIVHPAEIWKKTGRFEEVDETMVRFRDRSGRDMVLAMTHEEVVASLVKTEISTYKQLPKLVYQIQTKFRDEARSRAGLIRVREFVMKDSYSLDTSQEGLEEQYKKHYHAYFNIFRRAGLPVIAIQSDTGMMGGSVAHEYMYITDMGEDTIFICDSTGYKANKEVASIKKPVFIKEQALPPEKVHTPSCKTIEEVAGFLNINASNCGKVVFYSALVDDEEKVVMAVVRGDMEVNNIKLQNLIRSKYLYPASQEEITSIGSVAGCASPMGIDRSKVVLVVDDLVSQTNNLVLGANEIDYHMLNVCYGRDYSADFVSDIICAYDGALAPDAQTDKDVLRSVRGVETGNIFQLGSKYTVAMEAFFMDKDGKPKPVIMGSYGIGIGRLLGCLAEEYHDEKGLKLPISVAPYQLILVALLDNEEVQNAADGLYQEILNANLEVLYDDRPPKIARAGEKFGDADLVGCPIRLTISRRSLENGGVEVKLRSETQGQIIALNEATNRIIQLIDKLKQEVS